MNEMVMVGGMPDARDVALFRAQYQKAVNGLYEAYLFGVMLQKVKAALEAQGEGLPQGADEATIDEGEGLPQGANAAPCTPTKAQGALPQIMGENGDEMGAFTGSLTRENAREMTQRGANGGSLAAGGWNAGMGLKGWLAKAALEAQGEGLPQGAAEATDDGVEALKNQAFTGSLTRENAREMTQRGANGGSLAAGGWNAGMGLKGWLAKAAPEVNYKTAMRFLAVAEKVDEVLPAGSDEGLVRDYLAGKSARSLLGGKREGAGRKRKDYAAALGAAPEVAWKEIEEPLAALNELIVVQERHAVLSAVDRQTLLGALQMLLETVSAI